MLSDHFVGTVAVIFPALLTTGIASCDRYADNAKPNIILILTDDQGYGDIGFNGNPWIKTPEIDRLASEGVRFSNFHTGTTCAPTRAGIMTGRHNDRVGVWHTIMGRSILNKNEITLARVLKENGYKTGMFGKWHLGDNYPYRPQDRGFDEVFCHWSGGVGQITDYWDNDYFDDTYFRNSKPEKTEGYCTDVWFRNAIQFIEKNRDSQFFCYLATNAPHGPYHVPQKYIDIYKDNKEIDNPAFYGMITNIDENLGILRSKLEELEIEKKTILIFMTDNGTAAGAVLDSRQFLRKGYNAGMRGKKGSEYNGGHRVPFIMYQKGKISGGREIARIASFTDVMPTVLDLCGIETGIEFDGMSLKSLIEGKEKKWPERVIITDTQRDEFPVKWKRCAIMNDTWHLINGKELYNMEKDPGQLHDISADNPEMVGQLREAYENWWEDVSPSFNEYAGIIIDMGKENPCRLTTHDLHVEKDMPAWNQEQVRQGYKNNGFWVVDAASEGDYEFILRRWPLESGQPPNAALPAGIAVPGGSGVPPGRSLNIVKAKISIGEETHATDVERDAMDVKFHVHLRPGQNRLQTWFIDDKGDSFSAYYVYISGTIN